MSPAYNIDRLREPYYIPLTSFNFSIHRVTTVFSVTAALSIASLPAIAEETHAVVGIESAVSSHRNDSEVTVPSFTLDTIVVTSNPLLPKIDEMATATSIITGDALDSQVNSTLGDILANEVGVSADSFGQGASRPIIRG